MQFIDVFFKDPGKSFLLLKTENEKLYTKWGYKPYRKNSELL